MKKTILLLTLFVVSGFYTLGHNQTEEPKTRILKEAGFTMLDQTTRKPIADAVVYDAENKVIGISDRNGRVTFNAPASSKETYIIKVTGFNPVEINLKFATKKSARYDVLLATSASTSEEINTDELMVEKVAAEEKVKVYVMQDPKTYVKEPRPDEQELDLVFAVQLSASSKPVSDLKSLSSWEELGPLYVYTENGLYKVRIGPFDTQDEAKNVLLQAKERGKSDAFIVIQEGLEGYEPTGYVKYEESMVIDEKFVVSGKETSPTPVAEPVAEEKKVVAVAQPEPMTDDIVEYKVRLASYLKPGGFNTKDIDQYGPLESYRKGDWTIMLIGGFKTLEEAKRVQKEVVAKGYKDAMIVADKGGILEDVKQ